MSARHAKAAPGGGTANGLVAAVLGVVLLGAVAFGTWLFLKPEPESDKTSLTSATASESTTTTPSPTPTTEPTSEEPAGPSTALVACEGALKLGDAAAKFATVSADHWGQHIGAQLNYDSGRYTLAKTKAVWKASKATGDKDVADFRAAEKRWKAAAADCRDVGEVSAEEEEMAKDCKARADAAYKAIRAGATVTSQWANHLEMMKNKDHIPGETYHNRWMKMVEDARPALASHKSAHAALTKAPACSVS